MSSTRSAPAARASNTWYGSAMKSLRSTGSSTAARTSRRSSSEPPKRRCSVSTLIALAPPVWYDTARPAGSRISASEPREGLARLTSAMIFTRSAGARAARASRGAGAASASASTSARLRAARRSAASSRAPATRSASTLVVRLGDVLRPAHAVAELREHEAHDQTDHEQTRRRPHEGGHVEPEEHRAQREGDEHDGHRDPGGR